MVTAQLAQSKLGAAISWLAFEVMLSPRSSCDPWRQNLHASSLVKGSKGRGGIAKEDKSLCLMIFDGRGPCSRTGQVACGVAQVYAPRR